MRSFGLFPIPRLSLRALALPACAVLAIGTLACSDSSTGPEAPEEGAFSIELSGDVSESFTGIALFEAAENGFGIFAGGDQGSVQTFTMVRQGGRPSSGQFSLAGGTEDDLPEGAFGFVLAYLENGQDQVVLVPASGSVTIDESSSDRVAGSFEAELVGVRQSSAGADSLTASASGAFDAIRVSAFNPAGS